MKKIIISSVILISIGIIAFFVFRTSVQDTSPIPEPKATPVQNETSESVANIESTQLAGMLKQKDFLFVNVHIPYEGEIPNTDVFIPYDEIANNLNKLPGEKDAKIVLYCRSGRMSEIAGQTLLEMGYTNVSHLSGGMIDWEKNGGQILQK